MTSNQREVMIPDLIEVTKMVSAIESWIVKLLLRRGATSRRHSVSYEFLSERITDRKTKKTLRSNINRLIKKDLVIEVKRKKTRVYLLNIQKSSEIKKYLAI